MAQPLLTYNDLVTRYGTATAFDLLVTLEKAAKITASPAGLDEEARLQRAMQALDQNNVAA